MIYEKIEIDGEEIIFCVEQDDNVDIKVWVNDNVLLSLPIVYDGRLTIHLTTAGLAALESHKEFRNEDIKKVEFGENDGSLDDQAESI